MQSLSALARLFWLGLALAPSLVAALRRGSVAGSARDEPAVAESCQAFPGKRVLLTVVNGEYIPMLRNWHFHAKGFLTAVDQLVVVANDWEAFSGASAIHGAAIVDPNKTLHVRNTTMHVSPSPHTAMVSHNQTLHAGHNLSFLQTSSLALAPYGSKGFRDVVATKPYYILSFLDQNCTVFYVDVDTVWRASPFVDMAALGDKDLYLTDDAQSGAKDPITSTWYLCTCFMYAQPTPSLISFFREWLTAVPGNKEDQWPFNDLLKHYYNSHGHTSPVNFGVLPYSAFPPGCSAVRYPHAHVYHANWLVGIDQKVQFFENRDLWFH